MSKPAAEILQKFYLQLRGHDASADGTPITARQLESLVRLAEARARLELREEITAQDALVNAYCLIYLDAHIISLLLLSFPIGIFNCLLNMKRFFITMQGSSMLKCSCNM